MVSLFYDSQDFWADPEIFASNQMGESANDVFKGDHVTLIFPLNLIGVHL